MDRNIFVHYFAAVTVNEELDIISLDEDSISIDFNAAAERVCRDDMTVASITLIVPEDYP
jgi:hypothetical protein